MIKKAIIVSSILLLAILSFGTKGIIDQNMAEFFGVNSGLNIIRFALIGVLISLLLTNPPRSLAYRRFLGVLAFLIFAFSLNSLINNRLDILDAIMFLEASAIFGIEALELEENEEVTPAYSAR